MEPQTAAHREEWAEGQFRRHFPDWFLRKPAEYPVQAGFLLTGSVPIGFEPADSAMIGLET